MSSPTPSKLINIRSKIGRTNKHIADLETAIQDFMATNPYKVGVKRDTDTKKLVYYVSHVEDVPSDITQIAGDAIAGMVSILDHLAYQLFLTGGTGGPGRHIYFPIAKDATDATQYTDERKRKVKGIPPHVVAALDALEPYQTGKGHQLWVLNELNNLSKHRDLIAVGSRFRSMDLGAHVMALMEKVIGKALPSIPAFFQPADHLCPLKVGDELFIDAPDAEPNEKMQFVFDVALNEPHIIHAQPLLETIRQMARLVDGIVNQFSVYL